MGFLDRFRKSGKIKGKWNVGDKILRRYEVKDVKEGGFGIVYIAFDHFLRRWFAIKTFKDEFLWSEEVIKKFLREAEVWIKLDKHKHIVRAEFVQKIEGKPYIFLEYIDGKSLGEWIYGNLLDLPLALDFAIQICDGMEYASEKKGIVHRDIKPQNVLITKDYVAKITDFGLVKFLEEAAAEERERKADEKEVKTHSAPWVTRLGYVWGTRPYISPEQYKDPLSVDMRSDIFSFGVMLYEMLTGTLPFEVEVEGQAGAFLEYMAASGGGEAMVEPRKRNPSITEELNSLVLKCLSEVREKRFSSFGELKRELLLIYESITGRKYEIEAEPESLTAADWNQKGVSLHSLGRYDEAVRCFDRALEMKPKDALIWNNRGLSLHKIGRYVEAIKCFDRALSLNPRYHSAWNNRGVSLRSLGRFEESIESLDRALDLDPIDASTWNNKGLTLQSMGRFAEAIKCHDKAIELDPGDAPAWNNKGVALFSLKKYDEAIECYRKSLDIDPRNPLTWNNTGALLHALERFEEAISYFNKALEIDDRDLKALSNKGNSYSRLGLYGEAIRCFDAILQIDRDNFEALSNIGAATANLGRLEESLTYYDMAIELNPKYTPTWVNKGLSLHSLGRFEEAIACFDRALELEPLNAEILNHKGVALGNLSRFKEALKCFEKAIEINPDSIDIWNNRAVTLFNLGRFEEAVKSYEKALQLDPRSKKAKRGREDSLKYLYLASGD